MHMLKVKNQFPRSISVTAGKWQHLRAPWGRNPISVETWAFLGNPLDKRNSNSCVQQGKDKVFQLEYDRIYYPTHKAPSEFFPTMGSVYAWFLVLQSWGNPYLVAFFPSVWDFPSTSDSLRSSVGLWGSDLGNAVFKVSTMALTTICKASTAFHYWIDPYYLNTLEALRFALCFLLNRFFRMSSDPL